MISDDHQGDSLCRAMLYGSKGESRFQQISLKISIKLASILTCHRWIHDQGDLDMFDTLKYNLKHNRKSVMKNATAWFLFGAIILVFVFWGMTPRNQNVAQGGAAAQVNDTPISQAKYVETLDQMRRQPRYDQLQGMGDAGRQILQQQAIMQLVQSELIRQGTDHQHLWTTDAEVRDIIMTIPAFQEDGKLKPELYRAYLENTRRTPAEFEDEIRLEQSYNRTMRLFSASMKPLAAETQKIKELAGKKANVEFVSVPTENLIDSASIKEADAKAFAADVANKGKIKDYFENHHADFSSAEKIKVRHILIRTKAGDTDSEKKALAKIEDIAKQAKTQDFGKLASQYSEDPGSKSKGGSLDYVTRGKMVPEFEDAAFALPVNEISKPVKTQYGYHLIQVQEKKAATDRKLEDVQQEIAAILIAKDRSKQAVEGLQASLKKDDEAAIRQFIAEHKLKWDETGTFSLESDNIPKIGPNDDILRVAFALTPAHPLADTLVRQGPTAFILRYKAVVPNAKDKKEENSDLAAETLASRNGEDALRLWVADLRKHAQISTNAQLVGK